LALFAIAALATPARADVFRLLDDPREAAQARVDLFQQAEHEIDAIYFLARNDRITLTALALLRDAHRRGVPSVRLIVDANFQHIPKSVLAHLSDEGVEVRVYHPVTLRHPSWLFRRMHEKVVVVDGARYITGGRNLAESYFGLAKRNFIDRDVYVAGDSAAEADRHFESLWASKHVADLDVRVSPKERAMAEQLLDNVLLEQECDGFVAFNTARDWSDGAREVRDVVFLHDPPGAGPRIASRLEEILGSATKSIVIETPYLVPSKGVRALLRRKLKEGVSITILTNSRRSCDGILPYAGYLKYRHRLIHAGVDIREFKGPDTLHAKSAIVDDHIALVGSYNVDPRSENLNTEVMCVIDDEEVARELRASIDAHVRDSWTVRISAPAGRGLAMWAAKLLLPLIEGQL
jgi:phosphatidylserine/phosphatidylglycerophosphate/cardiolipin synthase-like enzyme